MIESIEAGVLDKSSVSRKMANLFKLVARV